jgi:hypothetical protein
VVIRYEVGVPRLKRVLILLFSLLPATLTLLSCGYTAPSGGQGGSGLKYRALVTNGVSAGTGLAGAYLLDAQRDVRANVAQISAGNTPGMMVLTPNKTQTLIFSGNGTQFSDNQLTFINNASETASTHLTLPGLTESIVISPDGSAAYTAVPTAPVIGQSPGVVEAIALSSDTITGQVDIPSVHFLAINNSGNRILAFSDVLASLGAPCDPTLSYLFVITPSNIGINLCPAVPVTGFDHPLQAFFSSDDNTAYVVNCGAECGGTQASVQKLEMTPSQCLPNGACPPVKVAAASEAFVNGSTMYIAGSYLNPSPTPCPGQTVVTPTCGSLTVFDLGNMTATSEIPIADGYHNRIALGANGQLFVGARTCTQIAGISACLSIYNTLSTPVGTVAAGGVVIPPADGDVTGIEPIGKRSVVYVTQGGVLNIYDTAFDGLSNNPNDSGHPGQIFGLVGDFVDVKVIDF